MLSEKASPTVVLIAVMPTLTRNRIVLVSNPQSVSNPGTNLSQSVLSWADADGLEGSPLLDSLHMRRSIRGFGLE